MKPGPRPGSPGAHRIAEVHRGSHEHDRGGGFAANPQLARETGKKGGEAVKRRYGLRFFSDIGRKGGKIRAENFRRKIQAKGPKVA